MNLGNACLVENGGVQLAENRSQFVDRKTSPSLGPEIPEIEFDPHERLRILLEHALDVRGEGRIDAIFRRPDAYVCEVAEKLPPFLFELVGRLLPVGIGLPPSEEALQSFERRHRHVEDRGRSLLFRAVSRIILVARGFRVDEVFRKPFESRLAGGVDEPVYATDHLENERPVGRGRRGVDRDAGAGRHPF